ncbi:MAG: glycosyltransferase family 2 protein [Elusimicrobia bacterium CG08_land_8_20_14_0_20_51_18]|nr:MAG: glycosyltransferase family 2 protein [Elusimicrobia bacterium CG08_land_8_20_14_0_20_51_18]
MQKNEYVSNAKISAVLLVRNEENNIQYCLETLGWCDEIVVVDMESADKTAEIAREYTKQVFSHPVIEAFDIAKKFAVEKASCEWIILIDADEMVPRPLAETLTAIAAGDKADIVEIPFRHYIMGAHMLHSGWGGSKVTRFFKRNKITFTGTIHGYMKKSVDARVMSLEFSEDNSMVHFNYLDSSHFVEKLNKYTSIEAQHLFDKGTRFSYYRLFRSAFSEFYHRFLRRKGYKDGVRGFSLSFMMSFYRVLIQIKLWEKYEFKNDPVAKRYERVKRALLAGWGK